MSKKAIWIVVACILVAIILGAGIYAGVKYYHKKQDQKKTDEAKTSSPTSTVTNNSTTAGTSSTGVVSERSNPGNTHADWLTYANFLTSYMISYPADAKIEDLSNPKAADIAHSKCIKISTDNYYVLVGSADTSNTCFRTGVGDDWSTGPTETVAPAGANYTITGMHNEAASAGYYNDFFLINLLDGVNKIEYGISVNEKYGTITKAAATDLVHQIVTTYNPAE
ncbi:MAG: hypothetical protein NTY30_02855 [Candidatus Berkelbacteria bacterium]|nr:hypothetical protein [Candidatus Berkelbacteria bacterium]